MAVSAESLDALDRFVRQGGRQYSGIGLGIPAIGVIQTTTDCRAENDRCDAQHPANHISLPFNRDGQPDIWVQRLSATKVYSFSSIFAAISLTFSGVRAASSSIYNFNNTSPLALSLDLMPLMSVSSAVIALPFCPVFSNCSKAVLALATIDVEGTAIFVSTGPPPQPTDIAQVNITVIDAKMRKFITKNFQS